MTDDQRYHDAMMLEQRYHLYCLGATPAARLSVREWLASHDDGGKLAELYEYKQQVEAAYRRRHEAVKRSLRVKLDAFLETLTNEERQSFDARWDEDDD